MVQLLTTCLNWKRSSSGRSSCGTSLVKTSTTAESTRGVAMGRGKVELIVHNGHAWSKVPQSREAHFYKGDVWHAIREATHSSLLAVWLLGGHDRQLSVDQFVLQDGCTYRTEEAHEKLQAICSRLGNPELAERENHAASIMAKEKNA